MTTLSAIEQSIINRLSPLRDAGIQVRTLPSVPGEWGDSAANGIITLAWASDNIAAATSISPLQQRIAQEWVLDIRLRALRDQYGLSVLRDAIYGYLEGFRPPDAAGKIEFQSFEIQEPSKIYWRYEARFTVPVWLIERSDDELVELPRLVRTCFETNVNHEVNVIFPENPYIL